MLATAFFKDSALVRGSGFFFIRIKVPIRETRIFIFEIKMIVMTRACFL